MNEVTALQERIAEELYYEQHPEGRHRSEWPAAVYPDTVHEYRDLAAAVLPIVEDEVRFAKAEALREAADSVHDNAASPYCLPCHRDDADLLHTIATEYETGDQA